MSVKWGPLLLFPGDIHSLPLVRHLTPGWRKSAVDSGRIHVLEKLGQHGIEQVRPFKVDRMSRTWNPFQSRSGGDVRCRLDHGRRKYNVLVAGEIKGWSCVSGHVPFCDIQPGEE